MNKLQELKVEKIKVIVSSIVNNGFDFHKAAKELGVCYETVRLNVGNNTSVRLLAQALKIAT